MMNNAEALEILRKEISCQRTQCDLFPSCGGCEKFVLSDELLDALKIAIEALEFCIEVDDNGR